MVKYAIATFVALHPLSASAQAISPGEWDVNSKVVDLTIPGLPGFMAAMMRGKSKAERKQLIAGQSIEALIAPDPKAHCRIDNQRITDGRYTQTLSCPQKQGDPLHVARAGTYTADGFTGRATMTGITPKGPIRIVLDQQAMRVSGRR